MNNTRNVSAAYIVIHNFIIEEVFESLHVPRRVAKDIQMDI